VRNLERELSTLIRKRSKSDLKRIITVDA